MRAVQRSGANALILASSSPRRIELLAHLGLPFRVLHVHFREVLPSLPPLEAARLLAWRKAETARRGLSAGIVVTADTVVALGDTLFGKPKSPADARAQLAQLSGRAHEVITAIALVDARTHWGMLASERSVVTMRKLTRKEIADYVATGEPLDKAGSYAIQGRQGRRLVAGIRGDYFNVVGLPLKLLAALAVRFGLALPRARIAALYRNPPAL
ncbi:MAG: Maf family protein [bacterium]